MSEGWLKEWLAGGVANAFASAILNPLDVSKTRMQIAQSVEKSSISMTATLISLYREGGLVGLWTPGLRASMLREMLYSGPRAGFYVPIRNIFHRKFSDNEEISALTKFAAALTTGTMGSFIASPVDLVKVRLMAAPRLYPSIFSGIRHVFLNEGGVSGLYKGIVPSTIRAALICAGELATYDHAKTMIKSTMQYEDGLPIHIASSLITGLVAATVAAPFDLLKTRTMNNKQVGVGPWTILVQTIRQEGVLTLYRGWVPAYSRLGPHALICFPIFEQLRRLFGLSYL